VDRTHNFLANGVVVHNCDLAARNLLVAKTGDQYTLKICDFGMSHRTDKSVYELSEHTKFPFRWSAPEVLAQREFSKPSDVWSFGVVVWEMLQNDFPYTAMQSNAEVVEYVCNKRGHLSKPTRIAFPEELWTIMLATWQYEASDRPTFKEVHKQLDKLYTSMRLNSNGQLGSAESSDTFEQTSGYG